MNILQVVNAHGIGSSVAAFALGVACTNIRPIVRAVINSRLVTAAIKSNPAIAEEAADELKKDVDAAAAESGSHPGLAPKP